MPQGTGPEIGAAAAAWSRGEILALAIFVVAALYVAVRLFARWRTARARNAVRTGDLLEYAFLAARYSWAAERSFAESWKLMPTGRRPKELDPPPAPETSAREELDELCHLRSALGEVRRAFNVYATAPDAAEGRGQEHMEWWRDQYGKPILRACGEVRRAIADASLWRFPSLSLSSRRLESILVRAQTAPR